MFCYSITCFSCVPRGSVIILLTSRSSIHINGNYKALIPEKFLSHNNFFAMLSRHISRPISQKFLDSNDTRSFKRKARESPKLQSKSSKYQKFYKNDSRIHTAHENGMLTTEDEKIQYPKNSVTQPNTYVNSYFSSSNQSSRTNRLRRILFKLNQEEVMQNMAEGPGETFYARGPDSISSIENLMDSDSSSHSSPIRSWSHCTTISSK